MNYSNVFFDKKINTTKHTYDYENCSDKKLIELINEKDQLAEDEFYKRYTSIASKIIGSYFIFGGDKDDLFQEAMIAIIKATKIYDKNINNNFRAFAELCIRRQIVSVIRNTNTNKNIILNESVSIYTITNNEDEECILDKTNNYNDYPETVVMSQEKKSFYEKFMYLKLSEFENKVLQKYLNDNNYEEIAISLNTKKKSVDNALQRIKKKIKAYGYKGEI